MLKSSWGSSINDVLLPISLIIKSVIVDVGLSIIIENCVKSFTDESLDGSFPTIRPLGIVWTTGGANAINVSGLLV
jgi:hypothetical protein